MLCSWIEIISILEVSIVPKAIHRFNELPSKLSMAFLAELEQFFFPLICMKTQKTLNSQSNLEKEKWSWRNKVPWLPTILQSYSNQNSMVLVQKQKYRSIEWEIKKRKPRNKPTHLWPFSLRQERQEYTMEKRQSLQ